LDTDFSELADTIAAAYPGLSPRLRTAAERVLARPEDVALLSMRRFAEGAGVHPSTMVRLAKAFSYDGYREFQAAFQRRLRPDPADFSRRAQELQARGAGKASSVLADLRAAADDDLARMIATNGTAKFDHCARLLNKAPKIVCLGRRSCFSVAHIFAYVVGMFRGDVRLFDGLGSTLSAGLRDLGTDDVLFAVGVEPCSAETVGAVEIAREKDVATVVLTDSALSPIAGPTETTIVVPNDGPSFFHSVAPLTLAAEALAALMLIEAGDRALVSIQDSERYLQRMVAYWRTAPDAAVSSNQGQTA